MNNHEEAQNTSVNTQPLYIFLTDVHPSFDRSKNAETPSHRPVGGTCT